MEEFTTQMKLAEGEFGAATPEEGQRNPTLAEAKEKDQGAYQAARTSLQSMLDRVIQLEK